MSQVTVWGVHMGAHVGDRPIEGGYVAIGWPAIGDLTEIAPDREAFKAALITAYPDKKAGAIPVDAGSMFKFLHELQAGDIVVYPSKADRMVNIGRFTGEAVYVEGDPDEYNHIQCAPMLFWLSEALETPSDILDTTFNAVVSAPNRGAHQCAAFTPSLGANRRSTRCKTLSVTGPATDQSSPHEKPEWRSNWGTNAIGYRTTT